LDIILTEEVYIRSILYHVLTIFLLTVVLGYPTLLLLLLPLITDNRELTFGDLRRGGNKQTLGRRLLGVYLVWVSLSNRRRWNLSERSFVSVTNGNACAQEQVCFCNSQLDNVVGNDDYLYSDNSGW